MIPTLGEVAQPATRPTRQSFRAVKAFFRAPTGTIGVLVLAVIFVLAIIGPPLWGAQADARDLTAIYAPPSPEHIFGTDALGRDVALRVVVAARLSVLMGLGAALIALVLGSAIGLTMAALPARARTVLGRVIDTLVSLPSLLTAIFLSVLIGIGVQGAVIGVGVALSFNLARIVSTLAMSAGGREYVNAARLLGVGPVKILWRYVLPNIAEPVVIATFTLFSFSVIAISGLSFLGLGVQSPDYDWGRMLTDGLKAIYVQPAGALVPALAIALMAIALGFVGEALARALNPMLWKPPRKRLRGPVATVAPSSTDAPGIEVAYSDDDLVRVRDLVVSFPDASGKRRIDVVKGVSFTIGRGEVLGIVGESGSGKTMTAMALARLTRFPGRAEGELSLEGVDLLGSPAATQEKLLARELSVIFQDPSSSLNPALRIGTQMILGTVIHEKLSKRLATKRAADRLAEVRMPAPDRQLRQHPHLLSGGMRQRVMIATAMMREPAIIVADEPTTALDVTVQAQIMDLLDEINERHDTAIVLISHNLALISQNCDRVLVMYAGRIVEDLAIDDLQAARHPYTRALLAAVPELDLSDRRKPLASIPGEAPDIASPPSGCPFHPRCPLAVERCKTELPLLLNRPEGGRVACHVANEGVVG